jgi:hypothetical protein
MGIKHNNWAARLTTLTLLVAICTVPQTPSSEAVNRCQALETIAFSSYSGTVGGAQIALTNYKNCLVQQYGSTKASLVPCARYHQIASAFVALSSSSRYLTKALVDYTWCVTGEKSIYESKVLSSCDAYLDVVRIALAAGDVALASFARDASSDCQTRTIVSAPTPTPTPTATATKSPTPSPTPTPPALLEMPLPPLPSFSGEVQIGKTVTLVWSSPISGYDSITYQWRQICTSNTDCRGSLEIPGATQSSYTIQSKDAGYGISVNILFKKAGYKNYERFLQVSSSVPTSAPTKKINFPTLPKASIDGNTFEGGELRITFSSPWMEGVTLTYQWSKRCILIKCPVGVGRDFQPILGATSSTYQTLSLDGGHQIQAVIVASKSGYNDGTVYTSFPPTLINGEPAVSGVLKEGNGLQGHIGLWPEGYSLEYRWVQSCKDGNNGVSDCYSTIPSANLPTLSITAAQVNKSLGFVVKGTKAGNPTIERYSRSYGTVVNRSAKTAVFLPTPPKPLPTAKPTSGVITQPSPMPAPTPSSVITQPSSAPLPNPGVDCTSNPSPLCGGAVAPSSPSTIPAPTPIVTPSTIPAPTPAPTQQLSLAPTPAISGLGRPGDILRVSPGAWDAGVKLTYQWLRSGVSTGISSLTYTVSDADVNQNITVRVTGTKAGFTSVSRESSSILVTPLRVLTLTPSPIISCGRANGQCYVGDLAKVVPGKWDSGVTLSFRWLRIAPPKVGRTLIGTGTTYKITESDAGKGNLTQIVVEVTGSLTGFQTVTVLAGTYPFRR